MGFANILLFSVLTGISFGMAFRTGGDLSNAPSFAFLDFISSNLDSSIESFVIIISTAFTILFVFRLAKFFREVVDYRRAGIITALLGFSGSLIVVFSPQDTTHVFVLGIAVWLVGIIVMIFYRKKYSTRESLKL